MHQIIQLWKREAPQRTAHHSALALLGTVNVYSTILGNALSCAVCAVVGGHRPERVRKGIPYIPVTHTRGTPIIREPFRSLSRLHHHRPHIDYQLVLGRRLNRQVGGLLALENAIDLAGRAPEGVDRIRAVGDQAANGDKEAEGVDRR